MKIKILYSHLNVSGGFDGKFRPSYFDFENCFKNFLSTIEGEQDVELNIIYDITKGNLENNWISKYKDKCIIWGVEGGTMEAAASEMYEVAKTLSKEMEDIDLFMFQENDYLFLKGWVGEIRNLYSTFGNLNYVTLYEHGDKYTWMHLYENLTSKLIATSTHTWRTIPNTCGSYICSKKIFLEDVEDHIREIGDANKWLWLEENKGRFLLSPVPSLSTHMMDGGLLAPTIDWKEINDLTL